LASNETLVSISNPTPVSFISHSKDPIKRLNNSIFHHQRNMGLMT
jgi:hypothetical protein